MPFSFRCAVCKRQPTPNAGDEGRNAGDEGVKRRVLFVKRSFIKQKQRRKYLKASGLRLYCKDFLPRGGVDGVAGCVVQTPPKFFLKFFWGKVLLYFNYFVFLQCLICFGLNKSPTSVYFSFGGIVAHLWYESAPVGL